MGDVSLRVELVRAIDTALDLARANRGDAGGHPGEESVLRFLRFEISIEPRRDFFKPSANARFVRIETSSPIKMRK